MRESTYKDDSPSQYTHTVERDSLSPNRNGQEDGDVTPAASKHFDGVKSIY
jgi:hypothetical protein